MGLQINGQDFAHPALDGIVITRNKPFDRLDRTHTVDRIVVHESVTKDGDVGGLLDSTERVLRRKKYNIGGRKVSAGVHLMCDAGDGELVQHNDLQLDALIHAGTHNRYAIGVEVVNPYYEDIAPDHGPWHTVIDARWAHKKRYVVPTTKQLETLVAVIDALTDCAIDGIDIPFSFAGMKGRRMAMGRAPHAASSIRKTGGIWAHCYTQHADGAFPVLYSYLRLCEGLSPEDAMRSAIYAAETVRGGWATL